MSIFGSIETSASGLMAQRLRLDTISNNIANINTTRSGVNAAGNFVPYRRQVVTLGTRLPQPAFLDIFKTNVDNQIGKGVQVTEVKEDDTPFALEYNPNSPDAIKNPEPGAPAGYVRLPNVNIVSEMVDLISASRAYEANVTVLNASKAMAMKALEIGKG